MHSGDATTVLRGSSPPEAGCFERDLWLLERVCCLKADDYWNASEVLGRVEHLVASDRALDEIRLLERVRAGQNELPAQRMPEIGLGGVISTTKAASSMTTAKAASSTAPS